MTLIASLSLAAPLVPAADLPFHQAFVRWKCIQKKKGQTSLVVFLQQASYNRGHLVVHPTFATDIDLLSFSAVSVGFVG